MLLGSSVHRRDMGEIDQHQEQRRRSRSSSGGGSSCLGELLNHQIMVERIEKVEQKAIPIFVCGKAAQEKKGEDFTLVRMDCERIQGDESSTFGVFAVFDGHNGSTAAVYAKDHLMNNVMSFIPNALTRDEWLRFLPQALVTAFVKTDKDFQKHAQSSGTTVSLVVVDRWTVTIASVGDSRCVIDTDGGIVVMTVDHRLDDNHEERSRITASGGEVGRLSTALGDEFGPLRVWPGGLCLSRSIGDLDVGDFVVPVPHVKQIKLPKTGGRIIIASDGVWDALSSERAAVCCRGLAPDLAAKQIVKEALKVAGLRDDTTCLVVDVIPPFHSKVSKSKTEWSNKVLEIFEEGSADLSQRYSSFPG